MDPEKPNIKITLEQMGGFVGYLRKEINSTDLPAEQREELERLIRSSNLVHEENTPSQPKNVPTVKLTIETGGTQKNFVVNPKSTNSPSAELVRFIQRTPVHKAEGGKE